MTRRIAVRGIVYKNGKMFAMKHIDDSGSEVSYWSTPGGGLDDGEALRDGLHREFLEETGIAPEIGKLLYIQQYGDGDKEYLEFFYHITNTDDYDGDIDLASTSHGQIEIARYGFIDPKTEVILPAFLQQTDIAQDIASGEVKEFVYLGEPVV